MESVNGFDDVLVAAVEAVASTEELAAVEALS